MIASVSGRVAALTVDSAVIQVGGVGIQVMCTPATLAGLRLGADASLETSLVVREDSLTLFGFADSDERNVFELLQTASGVGPKLAQAMLAVHGPNDLRRAITTEDLVALCRVSGVGRKGAQRIVLELKDRIGPVWGPGEGAGVPRPGAVGGWQQAVRSGLVGLGWSAREADSALQGVTALADEAEQTGAPLSTAELLRAALQSLSRASAP